VPGSTVVGPWVECPSHDAHINLHHLVVNAERWQQRGRANKSEAITRLLLGLSQAQSECWHFLYRASQVLLETSPQMRGVHPHFWDTFGLIAGRVVEAGDPSHSWMILEHCRKGFSITNDWSTRSFFVRAFRNIGCGCALRSPAAAPVLHSFRWRCEGALNVLPSVPKPIGDTVKWLFEAWMGIAKKCRAERRKILQGNPPLTGDIRRALEGHLQRTTCDIVREAFPLFRMWNKAMDVSAPNFSDCWIHWCEMLFEHTLPNADWSDEEVHLVATSQVVTEVGNLLASIRSFVDAWSDPAKKHSVEPWIADLDKAFRRLHQVASQGGTSI
jgi:hypothetical protein